MTLPHNIDHSGFRKNSCVGWRASDGALYHIVKGWSGWRATRRDATGAAGDILTAPTLTALGLRLAQA